MAAKAAAQGVVAHMLQRQVVGAKVRDYFKGEGGFEGSNIDLGTAERAIMTLYSAELCFGEDQVSQWVINRVRKELSRIVSRVEKQKKGAREMQEKVVVKNTFFTLLEVDAGDAPSASKRSQSVPRSFLRPVVDTAASGPRGRCEGPWRSRIRGEVEKFCVGLPYDLGTRDRQMERFITHHFGVNVSKRVRNIVRQEFRRAFNIMRLETSRELLEQVKHGFIHVHIDEESTEAEDEQGTHAEEGTDDEEGTSQELGALPEEGAGAASQAPPETGAGGGPACNLKTAKREFVLRKSNVLQRENLEVNLTTVCRSSNSDEDGFRIEKRNINNPEPNVITSNQLQAIMEELYKGRLAYPNINEPTRWKLNRVVMFAPHLPDGALLGEIMRLHGAGHEPECVLGTAELLRRESELCCERRLGERRLGDLRHQLLALLAEGLLRYTGNEVPKNRRGKLVCV